MRALAVDWDEQNAERRSSAELLAEHRRLVESGEQAVLARQDGDAAAALAGAAHVVDAIYELPVSRARADGTEQRRVPDGR